MASSDSEAAWLELVEGLFQLDPVRSYPERAATHLAHWVGAAEHRLELDESSDPDATEAEGAAGWIALPLRHGRQGHGTLHLRFGDARRATDPECLKQARWAARNFARGLSYADRLSAEGARRSGEDVRQAVARAPLTPRERDVVTLLVSGASTREIASQIGLTIATVNTYLKRIFSKLGVHSRVELVARMAGTGGASRDD